MNVDHCGHRRKCADGQAECDLVRLGLPPSVRPLVKESSCLACLGRFPGANALAPGKVVADVIKLRRIEAGLTQSVRGRCVHLGEPVARIGPECKRDYPCEHDPSHGIVQPCNYCQSCPDWESETSAPPPADRPGELAVWVAGYPSALGGADTELDHQITLWRRHGVAVNLVPMTRPADAIRAACDARGCRTWDYSPGIFAGRVVVSFCCGPFLKRLPEIVAAGKPKRVIWANCMTWTTDLELEAVRQRWIDLHLFQTAYQRDALRKLLTPIAVAELPTAPYVPYFDADRPEWAAASVKPVDSFGIGRISRDDPHKFHERTWPMLAAVQAPAGVKCYILGHGDKVRERIGPPPDNTDYLLWAAGAVPASEFYRRVHVVMHATGGSRENLPRVLLECWATGTVFLGEDAYGFRELITPGVDGFLCRSTEEMAVMATQLAYDPAMRARIIIGGRRALARYADSVSWAAWEPILRP